AKRCDAQRSIAIGVPCNEKRRSTQHDPVFLAGDKQGVRSRRGRYYSGRCTETCVEELQTEAGKSSSRIVQSDAHGIGRRVADGSRKFDIAQSKFESGDASTRRDKRNGNRLVDTKSEI